MATKALYMEVHCVSPLSVLPANIKLSRKKQIYHMSRLGNMLRQLASSNWKQAKPLKDWLLHQLGRKPMCPGKPQPVSKPQLKKPNKKLKVTLQQCPPPN